MKRGITSKYHGVSFRSKYQGSSSTVEWQAKHPWSACLTICGKRLVSQYYETEREAAIQYDKWVLEHKLDRPLNILKPKAA